MTTHNDLRAICSQLPGSIEGEERFSFGVEVKGKLKGYCWTWLERLEPKKARVPNNRVLAIRTPSLQAKELLLASEPERFFTEDHYNGFPAILVRLDLMDPAELVDLLQQAHESVVPKKTTKRLS
jgi:hypothetical protein